MNRSLLALTILACSLFAFGQTPRSDIVTLQNAVAATGNGTAFEVGLYGGVAVQVTGTFSATITFEATIDRTNWIAIRADNLNDRTAATTATAAGIYQVPLSGVLQFRARVSSYSSGNVTVKARGVAGVISLKQSSGGGGGGSVDSVFGRTGTVVAATNDYTWAQIDKTTSSLADIATRSASDLSSGTLAAARGGAGTISGILKANGSGVVSAAVSATDYAPATSGTAILKGDGSGGFSNAASGTDYEVPLTFSTGLTRSTDTITVNTSQNIATLSNLTSNGLVTTSGGAGTLGVTVPGSGVLTALAVNTGSAGAFVVSGGALGTPSSGTLTNATGLPISTGVSGLGTGVATALGVNVGSAGAPVLFNGAGGTPSSLTCTNCTGLPLSTGVTGDLPFANFVQAGSAGFVGATGAGDYSHRTPTQVTAALDAFVGDSGAGGTKGLVPAPSTGDSGKYLKGDGTWATVSASPGGSDTQLQRNNAGAFGGISGATSDGTNLTTSSGALRATSPRITTSILDTNGNTLLGITANGSATEYITIANNTATNAVSLTASSPTVAASAQAGTPFNLTASPAIAGNVNVGAAAGGSITFTAGNAARLTSGNANGGDYNFVATTGIGTGRAGVVFVPSGTSASNPGGIQFGTSVLNGIGTFSSAVVMIQNGNSGLWVNSGTGTAIPGNTCFIFTSVTNDATGTRDTFICRNAAAASVRFGNTDAASPVAQTLSVQNVVAGTSNTAGANWTLAGSRGTGTGAGGSIIFQTAPAGSSGSSQNSLVTAVTIPSTGGLVFPELASAPSTPASNNVQLYAKDNGSGVSNLYFKKDDGTEVNLSAVGSGIASINSDTTSAQTITGADDLTASTSSGTTTIQRVTSNATNVALMLPGMGGLPVVTDSASALVGSNNEIRVALIQVTQKATYNNIAFTGVTNSASGTASFAIYTLDGNTRVCYSGAISTTSWSGAGNQALSAACTLSPGLYWQAWTADNTTATARSAAGFANYFQTANQGSKALGATSTTATSGALPSTISTTITTNNSYPIPFFKLYN